MKHLNSKLFTIFVHVLTASLTLTGFWIHSCILFHSVCLSICSCCMFYSKPLHDYSSFISTPHCMVTFLTEISEIDLVPVSCCKRPEFDWDRVNNAFICQKMQGGPPATKVGSINEFLNYKVKADKFAMVWRPSAQSKYGQQLVWFQADVCIRNA